MCTEKFFCRQSGSITKTVLQVLITVAAVMFVIGCVMDPRIFGILKQMGRDILNVIRNVFESCFYLFLL